jgi:hypothetical protein
MAIKISPETRQRLIASLKRYAAENLDEELGDLKAGLLLDYCLTEIGPPSITRRSSTLKPISPIASPTWKVSATSRSLASGPARRKMPRRPLCGVLPDPLT